jgi:hypothetical protein
MVRTIGLKVVGISLAARTVPEAQRAADTHAPESLVPMTHVKVFAAALRAAQTELFLEASSHKGGRSLSNDV